MHFEAEEAIRGFGTLEEPDCNFISSLIKELLDKVKRPMRTDGTFKQCLPASPSCSIIAARFSCL